MAKDTITVYEKPTCSKCREAAKLLRDNGVEFQKVNYYTQPLTEAKLTELLAKMKLKPRDVMRTGEAVYKELKLSGSSHSDIELVKLMVKHPDLLQRPIVEKGSRAVLGRPTENIEALL
ncbi:MAG TPA: arsenate reductase (glutaredoxin) [Candidatus Obscuribacter sp.]|nr:arsenate reductase (glutaredoxin) [Candidatus Obscuribacter sp.]